MESLWPIIILWIVFSLLGARKKRQQRTLPGPAPADATRQAQGGFMQEMQRALGEMKRTAEAHGQQQQRHKAAEQEASAARYLAQRKLASAGRRGGQSAPFPPGEARRKSLVRPQRPLEDDDAEKSSEDADVVSLEGSDYDLGAERIAAVRKKAADRGARTGGSAEAMTAAQVARRAQRTPVPLGTATEHAAWHKEIGAKVVAPAAPRRPERLGRWADGSLRGAVVLAEILGRPGGVR